MPNQAGPTSGEQARQLALTQLRQAILRGEMAPAQRLVENELAEQFGVTRAGVRAALKARAAFLEGQLGLDRYGLREKLEALGVRYTSYEDHTREAGA